MELPLNALVNGTHGWDLSTESLTAFVIDQLKSPLKTRNSLLEGELGFPQEVLKLLVKLLLYLVQSSLVMLKVDFLNELCRQCGHSLTDQVNLISANLELFIDSISVRVGLLCALANFKFETLHLIIHVLLKCLELFIILSQGVSQNADLLRYLFEVLL